MYRQLFIDDLRQPPSADWVVVRSFAQALAYFDSHGIPERISFDHDLGERDGCLLLLSWHALHCNRSTSSVNDLSPSSQG